MHTFRLTDVQLPRLFDENVTDRRHHVEHTSDAADDRVVYFQTVAHHDHGEQRACKITDHKAVNLRYFVKSNSEYFLNAKVAATTMLRRIRIVNE